MIFYHMFTDYGSRNVCLKGGSLVISLSHRIIFRLVFFWKLKRSLIQVRKLYNFMDVSHKIIDDDFSGNITDFNLMK